MRFLGPSREMLFCFEVGQFLVEGQGPFDGAFSEKHTLKVLDYDRTED